MLSISDRAWSPLSLSARAPTCGACQDGAHIRHPQSPVLRPGSAGFQQLFEADRLIGSMRAPIGVRTMTINQDEFKKAAKQKQGNPAGHQSGQGGKEDQLKGGKQQPVRRGNELGNQDEISRPVTQKSEPRSKDQPPSHQIRNFNEQQLASPDAGEAANKRAPDSREAISTGLGERGRGGSKGGSQESDQREKFEQHHDPDDQTGPVTPHR